MEGSESAFTIGYNGEKFDFGASITEDVLNKFLLFCSQKKVTDIKIQPGRPIFGLFANKLEPVSSRTLNTYDMEVVARILYKNENVLAEVNRGTDLDFSYQVKREGDVPLRYRVNITGGRYLLTSSFQIVIRAIPGKALPIEQLDIEQSIIDSWRPREGLVLVTGKTGSGKSTLLSSGIRMLVEKPDANESVVEYSAPIEYTYDGIEMPSSVVFQSDPNEHIKPAEGDPDEHSKFAHCVRNALRRNATIAVIGEARDRATIRNTIEVSNTGMLIYSTLHTFGVDRTLRRVLSAFPVEEEKSMAVDLMDSLRMVISQKLVPKVGGGVTGIREYMIFDDKTREKFHKKPTHDWPAMARTMLRNKEVEGQIFLDGTVKALSENKISEETFKEAASSGAV
ncbi:type IV pilus twitching motility protein PilT [Pseudovibrio ascidiaceicola]|uniref:type IV pilus twitching motility protein PilT n=1 Tax=Pseudovibrio ascidiaceicola TaxID=285279 RepID=UPI003D36EDA3